MLIIHRFSCSTRIPMTQRFVTKYCIFLEVYNRGKYSNKNEIFFFILYYGIMVIPMRFE